VTLRLLAVHAHPDDESSKGAGTYAHYVAAGAAVTVVSCTGGERGDVQNETLENRAMAERDMGGIRRVEMAAATELVGFRHRWLGYLDSGLPETDAEPLPANCFALIPLEISAEPLVRIIRELRPQVLVTYDEDGGYPQPDHIRCHQLSVYAVDAAADPARYPQAGPAWEVTKLYYDRIFSPDDAEVTTRVPVGGFLDVRDAALRAHSSQVPPDHPFFFGPERRAAGAATTENFQLARSLVKTSIPESDLFAGIIDDREVTP
jgi:mycothiol S-conjugate amidase